MLLGHRRLRSELDAFVDGELTDEEFRVVASHLDECPGCSEASRRIRRIKAALVRTAIRRTDPAAIATLRDAARTISGTA